MWPDYYYICVRIYCYLCIIMRNVFLLILLAVAIVSCRKDEQKYKEFSFKINSSRIISEGIATKAISPTETLFEVHNLPRSTKPSEMISFGEIRFEGEKSTYSCDDISVTLNNVDSISHIAYSYTAVHGNLVMESPANGIIEGNFNFDFVCPDDSQKDTIHISNGHFRISYSTLWIQ